MKSTRTALTRKMTNERNKFDNEITKDNQKVSIGGSGFS